MKESNHMASRDPSHTHNAAREADASTLVNSAASPVRMTPLQRRTLKRLAALDAANELSGFNPCSFGGESAAACARGMAKRGWVTLSRISERHIRYGITVAGLMALGDAPAPETPTPGDREGYGTERPLTEREGSRDEQNPPLRKGASQ